MTETPTPKTDWEIASAAVLKPIQAIADRLGIPAEAVEPYGRYKAKLGLDFVAGHLGQLARRQADPGHRDQSDAGRRGQDHHHVGLGDALNRIGKRATICLREP